MTPATSNTGRRLVPRWRGLATTLTSLELAQPKVEFHKVKEPAADPDFMARLERWQLHPSLVTAAEYVEAAIVDGNEKQAIDAARRLIQIDRTATPLIHAQAAALLRRNGFERDALDFTGSTGTVAQPRYNTRLNPRDPLAWVELALRQVSAGHTNAASRSMRIALSIAPNNRHVLRSAARLFLHARKPEEAHQLIARNAATVGDPWLIAAEIALAQVAQKSPRFHKQGLRMLDSSGLPPRQLTELAGSVATEEFLNGSRKRSRRSFDISLKDPTGSALAQGEWASLQTGSEVVPAGRLCTTPENAEARAFHLQRTGHYAESAAICWEWAASDAISIRPFEFGSSLAGLVGDYEQALKFTDRGLQMRPAAPGLLNGRAFSLASTGRLVEAAAALSKVQPDGNEGLRCLTLANWGLIAFRGGDAETGRTLYRGAIQGFARLGRHDLAARARIFFAREARLALQEDAERLLTEAKQSAKNANHDENTYLLGLLEEGQPTTRPTHASEPPRTVIATFPNGEQRTFLIRSR